MFLIVLRVCFFFWLCFCVFYALPVLSVCVCKPPRRCRAKPVTSYRHTVSCATTVACPVHIARRPRYSYINYHMFLFCLSLPSHDTCQRSHASYVQRMGHIKTSTTIINAADCDIMWHVVSAIACWSYYCSKCVH